MSNKKMFSALAVLGFGMVLSLSGHALSDKQKKDIEERIKPVGSVCLEGDSSCGGPAAAGGGGAKSPADIYASTCHMCHDAGVGGAPKMGDKAAWKPRIAEGLDTLHTHAIAGYNAMPPKGTCASCSDDDIKATVDYMVSKSK